MDEKYFNSSISKSAKMYRNIRCVNSMVEHECVIADDCDIDNAVLSSNVEIGRRNILRNTAIGKGTYTATNTVIKNCSIGNYCSIASNVYIGGDNHNYNNTCMYTNYWFKRTFGVDTGAKDVVHPTIIGNDVWIGIGVCVFAGLKIGDGCVIGAGCVVNRDLPAYSIAVGVPCRIIKYRFSPVIIKLLLELKWWSWSEDEIKNNIGFLTHEPTEDEIIKLLERKRV